MTKLQRLIRDHLRSRMSRAFYKPECLNVKDNLWVACAPGYTVKQSLLYNFPILTIRVGIHEFYEGAVCDGYYWGNSVQLYEDANDVAGLSELIADRDKEKVSALRD